MGDRGREAAHGRHLIGTRQIAARLAQLELRLSPAQVLVHQVAVQPRRVE